MNAIRWILDAIFNNKNTKQKLYHLNKFFKDITKPTPSKIPQQGLTMGENSYHEPLIVRYPGDKNQVIIGKYCSIASYVKIFVGGEHRMDWISTYPFRVMFELEGKSKDGHPKSKGDVIIGNDVWIGYGTTILSGITIGDGAVIGAESLVTSNIEPYTIAAGNPCTPIRKRFSEEQIKKLLEIKWWDWNVSKVLKNVDLLCDNKIDLFIDKHYRDN